MTALLVLASLAQSLVPVIHVLRALDLDAVADFHGGQLVRQSLHASFEFRIRDGLAVVNERPRVRIVTTPAGQDDTCHRVCILWAELDAAAVDMECEDNHVRTLAESERTAALRQSPIITSTNHQVVAIRAFGFTTHSCFLTLRSTRCFFIVAKINSGDSPLVNGFHEGVAQMPTL